MRKYSGCAPRFQLVCDRCGKTRSRVVDEDTGGFGLCKCGGTLRRHSTLSDRRAAIAKADLDRIAGRA
jgi:hypothetical protein